MLKTEILPANKKVYFASDFHLGVGGKKREPDREKIIIDWLTTIQADAYAVFLLGDIFDFWFEYKHVIPKGFVRLQGKLVSMADQGIQLVIFTGNHDMWMFDYFPTEFGIPVYKDPQMLVINNKKFMIGHGDGLGPGDGSYKILKKVFRNRFCQWLFDKLHPTIGMKIAHNWSKQSRLQNEKDQEPFLGENEWLLNYCKTIEAKKHHDFYIFGHRHLPMDLKVADNSRYINLGEWMNYNTYAEFDGENVVLKEYK